MTAISQPETADKVAQAALDAIAAFLRATSPTVDERTSVPTSALFSLLDAANTLSTRLQRATPVPRARESSASVQDVEISAEMLPPAELAGMAFCRIERSGSPAEAGPWLLAANQAGTVLATLATAEFGAIAPAPTGDAIRAIVQTMETHGLLTGIDSQVRRRARAFAHAILALQHAGSI